MTQLTNLQFRKADAKDARWCNDLRNDPAVLSQLQDQTRYSREECERWLSNLGPKSERWIFTGDIVDGNIRTIVNYGLFRIDHIDYQNRHCAVGLDIDADSRGKGLAVPTYKMMLNYLFLSRNFNRVWLEVLSTNLRAINLYLKIGFQMEGTLKEFYYRNGMYYDVYRMGLSKSNFHGY